ncbi:MAG TPA: serine/threonine-protein kinase, partial [Micromonosporaceae bacterium]|nr:serine/threonine-protein kinase [Micromonosporaceae bacterium]
MQRRVGSRYVLSELLGRGSFGTVWRGEGPAGPVAVKILREEFADNPELVNRFIRERAAMRRLSHPHIVPVRDLVAEGDLLALVMDVIDGPNLREHLRDRSRLTVAEALGLAAAMATALAHAHDQGVVHRDVKPENVLLHPAAGGESVPMLTDFGIARLVEETSTTRSVVLLGTPLYMAPELADGQRGGPPADVYATGVVLYELLAGHPPFTAEHPLAVLRQHVTTAPARPRGVADPVWALLAECLAKDPAARPTAAVLARRLNELADGRITGWASPPAAPTLRAPTGPLHSEEGRAPRAVRAGLAATIAVVLGLGGCLAGAAGGYRAGAG